MLLIGKKTKHTEKNLLLRVIYNVSDYFCSSILVARRETEEKGGWEGRESLTFRNEKLIRLRSRENGLILMD